MCGVWGEGMYYIIYIIILLWGLGGGDGSATVSE